jgi:hypothetical protein
VSEACPGGVGSGGRLGQSDATVANGVQPNATASMSLDAIEADDLGALSGAARSTER